MDLRKWTQQLSRPLLLELFILFNLAFLIVDVLIAHAVNDFHHWAEWVPVAFSAAATLVLAVPLLRRGRLDAGPLRTLGLWVGFGSIAVGVAGLLLHLDSHFFVEATLHNLVYSAPFAAPLAYAGLGFLLLLNRLIDPADVAWTRWVLFFAWGGFVGNLALSVADHAQNGFFFWQEWLAVAGSALAVGFFFTVVALPASRTFIRLCFGVLALQAVVGLLGFGFHLAADWPAADATLRESFVFGAPVFAPLLFLDLSLLAALGLWDLYAKLPAARAAAV